MTSMSSGAATARRRYAPPTPLVADPAEPRRESEPEPEPEPEQTFAIDPDGESLALRLVLPAGVRVRLQLEATSTDAAAVRWLHDLGVAALSLAMHCEDAATTAGVPGRTRRDTLDPVALGATAPDRS